ncbi:MAG: hypothetical protein ACRYF4_10420 [Janthinobacterium lividum]
MRPRHPSRPVLFAAALLLPIAAMDALPITAKTGLPYASKVTAKVRLRANRRRYGRHADMTPR